MIKNIVKMSGDFWHNLKEYLSYLMKVDFKDLAINTVILVCILVLSCFVYVPIYAIKDMLFELITTFFYPSDLFSKLFMWLFSLISFVAAVLAFMYLFNLRYNDVMNNKDDEKSHKNEVKKDSKTDELDLPKTKK